MQDSRQAPQHASQPTLAGTEPGAALPTMDDLQDLQTQLDSIDRTLDDLDDR